MATRMQQRRGTAAQWISTNSGNGPILSPGEIGFESDTNKFKIGDGVNHWVDLTYFTDAESITTALNSIIDGAPAALNTLNELAAALGDDENFLASLATETYVDTAVSNSAFDASLAAGTGLDWNADTDQFDIDSTIATQVYVGTEISTHSGQTDSVHGIADTAELATKTYANDAVSTHSSDTTSVHGISDTSLLVTTTGAQTLSDKTLANPTITIPSSTTDVYGPSQLGSGQVAGDDPSGGEGGTRLRIPDFLLTGAGWSITPSVYVGKTVVISGASVSAWNGSYLITAAEFTIDQLYLSGPTIAYKPHGAMGSPTLTLQQVTAEKTISTAEIGHIDGVTSAIQTQLDAKALPSDILAHSSDTTSVHGIADTSLLATQSYSDGAASTAVDTHNSETTDVHGIADTDALATKTYADTAVGTHNSDTTNVHGISDTSILFTTSGGTINGNVSVGNVTSSVNKYVAVSGAKVTTSDNGVAWSASADLGDFEISRVAAGAGKFVGISPEGYLKYSSDGITWTNGTTPVSGGWYGVAYGNGKFIAISQTENKNIQSTDGITWTEITVPSIASYRDKIFTDGAGKWLISSYVAFGSSYAYSIDNGVNWSTGSVANGIGDGVFGNGYFYALSNIYIKHTSDFVNWTNSSFSVSGVFAGLIFDGTKTIALANRESSYPKIFTTTGTTWNEEYPATNLGQINAVSYFNGKYFAAGTDVIHYSSDALTWTSVSTAGSNDYWQGIAGGSVAVTSAGQLSTNHLTVGDVSNTEISYLNGVTSSIQTQLNAKATPSDISSHASDTTSVHGITDTADLLLKSGGTMTGSLTLSGEPSSSLHAATKQYVDNTASGIVAKPQVLGATTANIDATYDNGTAGVGATLTHNTNGEFPTTAGGAEGWAVGKGILVKNQTNKAQNGRYYVSDMGSPSTPYVLTRCGYCDEASEIPGAYIFVQDGTNAGTGWVQTVADATTFTVGTDDINVVQFSGSGTITAGTNISVSGNEVSVVATPTLSGVEFSDGTQTKEGVASRTSISQKTDSYTLSELTERDSLIEVNKSSASTITIPLNATVAYPVGTSIDILQTGTGQVSITIASGGTLNCTPSGGSNTAKLRAQWSSATLFKRAENTWVVMGDLTA